MDRIAELTGDGVDIVIDPIGGAGHLWDSYRTLRRGGRLVWLGSAAVEDRGISVGLTSVLASWTLRVLPDGKRVPRCPTMDVHATSNPQWYRETLSELVGLLADGDLAPVVAERVPLADAQKAHAALEQGGHRGKFVLITDAYRG